jgi:hypothetical protein
MKMVWGKPGGAGRFVAVNGQNVSYSPDGVTWTGSRVLNDAYFKSITWGGPAGQELFVAGTSDGGSGPGDIYWSSDGIVWTRVVDDKLKGYAKKIIWGGGKFVALSSSQKVRIAYSSDGKEWINGSLEAYIFNDITYTGTEYVVSGSEMEGGIASTVYKIWSSSDLETWTETVLPVSYHQLLYKDGRIYAQAASFVYSTDKITWTVFTPPITGKMFTVNGKMVILSTAGKMVVQE